MHWDSVLERNGVRIHRVAHTSFAKRSLIGKGLNFLSLARASNSALRTIAAPDVVVLVKARALTNVRFFDYQPLDELSHSLTAANLHLVPLTKELSCCLMPSKLYGILAAGRPYLTNAPVGSELHSISTTHNVGLTVEPGSAHAIANRVQWAADHPTELDVMGHNGRKLAESEYTQQHSIAKFRTLLEHVLEKGSGKGV